MWIILGHRAQRLAKLQMNFVTAVSHDLRTPITIISSAADNIARGVVHERQQVAQYGTVIGSQARRLSAFVEQVLLFASIRDSSHRYVLRPIDVADAIETTLAASAELIQASRVTVERDIEPNLPPVMGDSFGLSQCLQNLITNALKYGGEPAWLGVRAVLAKNGAGTEIQVSISDKGIGIPPSDLRHIFRPFYRSPSVTATQIHGTGLGLAVANSVAEAMNGHLTVVSVRGEGSTFTLHLPCAKETTRSPALLRPRSNGCPEPQADANTDALTYAIPASSRWRSPRRSSSLMPSSDPSSHQAGHARSRRSRASSS